MGVAPVAWQRQAAVVERKAVGPKPGANLKVGLRPEEEDSLKREGAVQEWLSPVKGMGHHSTFVRDFGLVGEVEFEASLRDVLAPKAETTLRKRASQLEGFLRWVRARGAQAFPVKEAIVYAYLCDLRGKGRRTREG